MGSERLWCLCLIGIGSASSVIYPHAPLISFAAIAGTTLSRRQAITGILWIWLANQLCGYGFRHYPVSFESLLWGIVMGLAAVATVLLASIQPVRLPHHALWLATAFLLGFGLYQSSIFGLSQWMGMHGLTAAVMVQILTRDALWLLGLLGLHSGLVWHRRLTHIS